MIEVFENPEAGDEQLAAARPFAKVFPEFAATMRHGRGPQKVPIKVQINLRVDPATLEHFKAGGPGWQVRMNEALDRAAGR